MCRPDIKAKKKSSITLKLKTIPCHGEKCRPEFDIKSITIYTPLDDRGVSIKGGGYQANDHRIKVSDKDQELISTKKRS